jgi:hypothetical protein
MRELRRFFYVNVLAELVGFAVLALGCLKSFPSISGVVLLGAISVPLLVWHQSYVQHRTRCPNCREILFDSDGIPLHAKKCQHCHVELR